MSEDNAVDTLYESPDLPAIADDKLVSMAEQAEKRIEAVNKIKRLALRVTNAHDWNDQQGKPYLQVSGSEKVARLFGISWRIDEPVYEPLESGHFSYTYKGEFAISGARIEAIGTRSSKDPFFKKYGKKDNEGNRVELPASEIDKGDVKKAAYTNCIGNGITRLLGIRNLEWDDLEKAGIKKDSVGKVEYRDTKTERTGKISEPQRKRWYAIGKSAGKTDDELKAYLKDIMGVDTSNDMPAARYEEACKWAETKKEAA